MLTNARCRGASARALDVFDRRYNSENDCDRKCNRKSRKDKTTDHTALSHSNSN
jgi:hypothetical protein